MNLEQLFLEIINLSLLGTLVTLIILIIRQCFERQLSQLMKYSLWAIVLIRLIVPFSFSSNLSILHLVPQQSVNISSTTTQSLSKINIIKPPTSQQPAESLPQATDSVVQITVEKKINSTQLMSTLWLGGTIIFTSVLMMSYFKTTHQFQKNRQLVTDEQLENIRRTLKMKQPIKLYRSPYVSTPLVMGIIKPCILIPNHYDIEDEQLMHYILMHEMIHIKRRDNLLKVLALIILSLHWFNPIIWWAYFKMLEDMESSCDERVLKLDGNDIRKGYAKSLLEIATLQKSAPLMSAFVGFGESNLKKRVKYVMSYKGKTKLSVIISILLLALVGCSLMSNPITDNTKTAVEYRDKYVSVKIEEVNLLESELQVTYSVTNLSDATLAEPSFSVITEIQGDGEIIEPIQIEGEIFSSLQPQETTNYTVSYDIKASDERDYVVALGQENNNGDSSSIIFGVEFAAQALIKADNKIDPTTQVFEVWNHNEVSEFENNSDYILHQGPILTNLTENIMLSFEAPKSWSLNSNTNNITWDGNFKNGELSIGYIGVVDQFKEDENIHNNALLNRESLGRVGIGYEEKIELISSKENKAGAYYQTDKFTRVIAELGNYRHAEYIVDLGNGYYGNITFYISSDVTSKQLEIYDNIVNTMSIEES